MLLGFFLIALPGGYLVFLYYKKKNKEKEENAANGEIPGADIGAQSEADLNAIASSTNIGKDSSKA